MLASANATVDGIFTVPLKARNQLRPECRVVV